MLDYIQTKFSSKQIHKWKLHKIALDHQEMAMDRHTPPPPPSTSMNREKLPTEIDSSYTYVYHIFCESKSERICKQKQTFTLCTQYFFQSIFDLFALFGLLVKRY